MDIQRFSLYDMLARNAEGYAERAAVVTESGAVRSYRELRSRVDALAAGLAHAGLGKGDRVCVLAQNSAAYLELYLAGARLGLVAYPLNWRLSKEELARILERARPRALAFGEEHLPLLGDADCELKIQLDGAAEPPFTYIEALYRDGAPAGEPAVGPEDPFAIIATAAVDVVPRGAVLSHRNVLAANLQQLAAMGIDESDANLVALPLFHIAALGTCMAFVHAGGLNVIMPRFDPGEAVRLIDEHGVTHVSDFPPVLAGLLDAAASRGSRLASLRMVSGLDAPDTIERLHDATTAEFWTGFGQTETSGFVTFQRAKQRVGCAGKPGALTRIKLVDDYDQEVPAATAGEILVRGPVVFQGYDGLPEVTEHTFRGGWHHTGDVGRLDNDGRLYYVKRKAEKELIKPGGENVYPAEVETVIMQLEAVTGVCVFGVPDQKWGEAIMAVVEAPPGALTEQAVAEHVGGRIARFKRPQRVAFTESLPRDADGAVDREAVKTRWASSA